ncbi:MAG TPA: DUF423 domain-containing protein [Porticoccaceae bacterium]|nr:DUF423 domain-containing protein [Porticoccaceae bacterium]
MNPRLVCFAAILGFSGVALGAFGAHGLRGLVAPEQLAVWRTAVEYQMFHALALLALAAAPAIDGHATGRLRCGSIACGSFAGGSFVSGSFVLGILLFSGSLYLLVLSGMAWLGAITPLGGLCLLAGWGSLAVHGWRAWRGARP